VANLESLRGMALCLVSRNAKVFLAKLTRSHYVCSHFLKVLPAKMQNLFLQMFRLTFLFQWDTRNIFKLAKKDWSNTACDTAYEGRYGNRVPIRFPFCFFYLFVDHPTTFLRQNIWV